MMKIETRTILLLSILSMSFLFCYAQQVERQVIASGGDYQQNDDISVSYTVGETFDNTLPSQFVIITEGFQQTDLPGAITGIDVEEYVQRISFFPNPVTDQLHVTIKTDIPNDFNPTLFDQTGKKVVGQRMYTYSDGKARYLLMVSDLSAGTYTLIVQPNLSGPKIGFKVIKME